MGLVLIFGVFCVLMVFIEVKLWMRTNANIAAKSLVIQRSNSILKAAKNANRILAGNYHIRIKCYSKEPAKQENDS